jgi:hypothetical protein
MDLRVGLDAVENRKIFFPCRASNPGRRARSRRSIPTELSQPLSLLFQWH